MRKDKEDYMNLKTFVTGPIQVNTYLLTDEKTKEAILIDVGGSFEEIKNYIDNNKYNLKFVLNTHGHFDHVLGEIELQEKHPEIPVYMNKNDLAHLSRLPDDIKMMGYNRQTEKLKPDAFIDENSCLYIGEEKIKILYTPGHSKGSLSYYIDNKLFSGDALFQRSIGRTDLFDGDYDELITSIRTKLLTLPDETIVYPGHGPKTTIREEKKYNPYLNF